MKSSKKVLVISYFFPPLSGPGVQRAFNFVKNLPSLGWKPLVLTVKDVEYVCRDEELLAELEDIEITRTESLDPMRFLYLWQNFRKKKRTDNLYRKAGKKLKKFGREIFPIDSKISWLFFSLPAAKKLCRIHKIDLIFATMSPYTSGILAFLVSRITGIPYVLDYRDLWQGKPDLDYFSRWHKSLAVMWEKKIISKAAVIIQATKGSGQRFLELYPDCPSEKVRIITNGYDENKIASYEKKSVCRNKIKFTFAGHFYGGQSPAVFLKSVYQMENSGKLLPNTEFCFIGNFGNEIEQLFKPSQTVKRISYLSYQEYFQKLFDSDILLLFISSINSEMILPQKLFDYLAVRRPILAIVPVDGEAAQIIKEYRAGIICDGNSSQSIEEGISGMLTLIKSGNLNKEFPLEQNDYSCFERRIQAKQLTEIFREVINE